MHSQALSRREFLRVGGLSALGLSLPALLGAEARASTYGSDRPKARAKSCIFLFLAGGPSQYETFDPKPNAPSEIRSIFRTISTSVPGTFLSEHLADLAKQAHRFALIRSVHHRQAGHFGGHRYALTGYVSPGNADQPARADDRPGIVSLAAKYLQGSNGFPAAVMAPWVATDQGSGASGGMGGGVLGKQYDPVRVEIDPATLDKPGKLPVFRVPEFALQPGITPERFAGRRGLLDMIETQRRELAVSAGTREMDGLYRQAYELLSSTKIREGFDLDQEQRDLRERYGLNAFGQSCLLARRLVERGARFVQVNFARTVTQNSYGWDTHGKGAETLKQHLVPKLNAGLASLLDDLAQRGLLDETLVVATGEFGRTPRVKNDGGRDHWPQCYSLLMAGGGIKGGLVYGRSDKNGAYPASDPVEPREILLTILTLLGIPTFVTDSQGRAAPLFEGSEPIARLYS
jgi:hypothetical protein